MKPTEAVPHPNVWPATTVGKSLELRRGVSWSKDQESTEPRVGRVPVIRIGNVQSTLDLSDVLYLSDLSPEVIAAKTVGADWTLIVGSNGNRKRVGNAVLVREDTEYLFASFLLGARPRDGSGLNPDYFYRWLSTEEVQAYLSATAEGSTGLNNLSHSFFRSMLIPTPPPQEQQAICQILEAADLATERADALVRAAKSVERAIVEDSFARLSSTPRRLKDFIVDIRYGTSRASNDRSWGYPTLRIPNIISDRLRLVDVTCVDLPSREARRLELQGGDLLLVRTNGNPTYVGRSAVFRSPDPRTWTYASYLIRVRLGGGLLPDFVHLFLGTQKGRAELLRRVTTSAGNHNINANSIRLLSVPVPAREEDQQDIIDLAQHCRAMVEALVARRRTLNVLRNSLAHDLVLGRFRLPSLQDTLAS